MMLLCNGLQPPRPVVAYVLWITDIDPLKYDLLFERFLNPSRVSMPDIDVDFCEANRGRVIDYVREKYGQETVCQIVTFGTLKPKAVIKDVGRVLSLPFSDVDRISKLIPDGPKLKTLEQAFRESPELAALRAEPHYEKLFDMALRLEGINRHCGKHAAGVVIADTDLLERIPLTVVKGDKTTAFTMTEVEECGLLKMDFLGLRTLTLIDEVVRLMKPETFIMHPGPMNRDVEIASSVADGPRQVILDQVANGVAVRMALIYLLSGGDPGALGVGAA